MSKYYQEILEEIKKRARGQQSFQHSAAYSGSQHTRIGITVPESRKLAKAWAKAHSNISFVEFKSLLDSFYTGESTDEKKLAGQLLEYKPKLRAQIEPKEIDRWLDNLEGWEEIDSLCQSVFSANDIFSRWNDWKELIERFVLSSNISKRRASLVLLTGIVSKSEDSRLSDLAFSILNRLKSEREVLITKAVSWLLRDLIKYHKKAVEAYLKENENVLPKIALRETRQKLATGRK